MMSGLPVKRCISDVPDVAQQGDVRSPLSLPRDLEASSYAINPMQIIGERVVIAMVGLPARGKSYTSKAIVNYFAFLGCPVQLFNAGNKRRTRGLAGAEATFFDPSNRDAQSQRDQLAMETLDDLLKWLDAAPGGCACAIFDATNTTVARRRAVIERCARAEKLSSTPLRLLFVENICNDEAILRHSYRLKLSNGDYHGMDQERALSDFTSRVKEYEKVYETITDEEARGFEAEFDTNGGKLRYVQTVDAGRKLIASGCSSYLMAHLVSLLHTIHLYPRKISLLITGESENDRDGIRGGDTKLSADGLLYSAAVCELVRSRGFVSEATPFVFSGTLQRYQQVVELLCGGCIGDSGSDIVADGGCSGGDRDHRWAQSTRVQLKALNELGFGSLEGLPGGKLRHSFPAEFDARARDPLRYRYPGAGGDSYLDVVRHCREFVLDLERIQTDVAVVCDVAVARVLLGYFEGCSIEKVPEIEVTPGMIELVRNHGGFSIEHHRVSVGKPSLLAA